MKIFAGFDIGSVSIKAAVAVPKNINNSEAFGSFRASKHFYGETRLFVSEYHRIKGDPRSIVLNLINEITAEFQSNQIIYSATGSGAGLVSELAPTAIINEFKAIAVTAKKYYPDTRTILEMGGESSKYIHLEGGNIVDYSVNGDCAAGTGSFIDQQAERLGFKIEELGKVILSAKKPAKIAGRCSVFAKSDMIHAQQKGHKPPEVLLGLANAVARNFKATIVKGKPINLPVILIGGLAKNTGVINSLVDALAIGRGNMHVPDDGAYWGAIGSLLTSAGETVEAVSNLETRVWPRMAKLTTENVIFLKNKVKTVKLPKDQKTAVYLGIDVGSVSTNLVLTNENGEVVDDIYVRTKARPIEVVSDCLLDIEKRLGDKIHIVGVGTTGSGRELIGHLVGADTIRDEITAHKTGAMHISKKYLDDDVDTIFEIGGQDAKYIYMENGVVTDFAMNEACAAGTGSFLEEQALKMGIKIKKEFAQKALSSEEPIKLGERCTVFIEKDVNAYKLQGASTEDLLGGLAYSIATNYLNRVVGRRTIGKKIFFQGGTAYNDAVAAAFSKILGQTITVPPFNGVIGAVGSALLAKDLIEATGHETTFKGFDLSNVNYSMREFTCHACTNTCDIQEFTVDGKKTFWGDKCSEKYRSRTSSVAEAKTPDLFQKREEIMAGVIARFAGTTDAASSIKIGLPRAMYHNDQAPFWQTLLTNLGFTTVVSDETNKEIIKSGLELTVAEPCYPIKVAHGHVKNLLTKGVQYIWAPNVTSAKPQEGVSEDRVHYMCPWGMTLPFVFRTVKDFKNAKIISPTIPFHYGREAVLAGLTPFAKEFNLSKKELATALDKAYEAEKTFHFELAREGEAVLEKVLSEKMPAIIVLGRPYNSLDRSMNLNLAHRLRNEYGINVIPMDFIPTAGSEEPLADNMFWNYGRRILTTVKFANKHDNLEMIYITNFKCGPDSYVKHYAHRGSIKPFLILQFDEHSNDAGFVTRIEAYLDSKGLLKTVTGKKQEKKIKKPVSKKEKVDEQKTLNLIEVVKKEDMYGTE